MMEVYQDSFGSILFEEEVSEMSPQEKKLRGVHDYNYLYPAYG